METSCRVKILLTTKKIREQRTAEILFIIIIIDELSGVEFFLGKQHNMVAVSFSAVNPLPPPARQHGQARVFVVVSDRSGVWPSCE